MDKNDRNALILSLLIVILCCAEANNRCPTNLPSSSAIRTYREKCFQFVYIEKHWPEARDFCWKYGGRLVKINDGDMSRFIARALNSLTWTNNGVWIGLHDRTSELRWTWVGKEGQNDESLNFWNWADGHPGAWFHTMKDCVRITRDDGWKWHETFCDTLKYHYRFICEYDMLPTTTTLKPSTNVAAGVLPWGKNHSLSTENKEILTSPERKTSFYTHSKSTLTSGEKITSTTRRTTSAETEEDVNKAWEENIILPVSRAQHKQDGDNLKEIIGSVIACIALVALILILIFLVLRRRKKFYGKEEPTASFSNPTYGGSGPGPTVDSGGCNIITSAPLPTIPRLENQEPTVQNIYSDSTGKASAGASDCNPLKGGEIAECIGGKFSIDNEEIDNQKNLKSMNSNGDAYGIDKSETCLASACNMYTPKSTESVDNVYSEPHSLHGRHYLPMSGSQRNNVHVASGDNPGSTSSVSSVGFEYEAPHSAIATNILAYDIPKPEHIYSEIPGGELNENIYETLDDIKQGHRSETDA